MANNIVLVSIVIISCSEVTFATMESFIVGGEFADLKEFPHAVFLSIQCKRKSTICGGSILNQMIILTAAHCLERCVKSDKILATVGSEKKRAGSTHKVRDFITHEDFNNKLSTRSDVALALVETPMKFGPKVKRVIIMREPPDVKTGFVAGWGLSNEEKNYHTRYIKKARQHIWKRKKCHKAIGKLPIDTLCGGDLYAKDYAARGDSGSALMIRGNIQVGLVSFKYMTPGKVSLTVYSDVGYHYDWITRNADKLVCRYN